MSDIFDFGFTAVDENELEVVQQAQKVFLHRAKMNSLAVQAKYNSKLENG